MRRMLAAVLVLGVALLGFGLLDTRAQVSPVAPIGPDERPIAQTKSPALPGAETPKLIPTESPRPLQSLPTAGPAELPSLPSLDPTPAVKLDLTPVAPVAPLEVPNPALRTETPPKEQPKKLSPPPVVHEEMKIPPPERAFPEAPKMPRIPDPTPALTPAPAPAPAPALSPAPSPALKTPVQTQPAKPEPAPVAPVETKVEPVRPEVKSEVKAEVKSEVKPEPVDTAEKRPIPTVAPTRGVAPSVHVEVRTPDSIGIHQQLDFEIVIKNVGPVGVNQLRIEDELPRMVKFVGSEPMAELVGEKMVWALGSLEVGAERRIKVAVKPSSEGDWRSRPVVSFAAQVMPVQVTITRPKLQVTLNTPVDTAYVGEEVPLSIEVKNAGSGVADKVTIRAQLSDGLFHPQAREAHNRLIEAELANLAAGESRSVTLKVKVLKAGSQGCLLTATAEGSAEASARSSVQCAPPPLTLRITGAQRAMVRSEPTFNLEVANTEQTASPPVQIAAAFPEGLEFVSATEGGNYDAEKRVLTWNLGAMQPAQKRSVTVKTRANASGTWAIRAVAQAGPRQEVRAEWVIQSEGVPGLNFEISSKENPVEVGKEATYEIRVVNQGTSPCTQIRLLAAMSEGMTPTTATLGDASLPFRMNGQTLVFDAIPKLAGQSELVIRLKARSTQAGDQRCKVQVGCDQLRQPIVKEESTFFFMQ